MSMLINFGRRHKKKLIFTVVFVGGTYLGIRHTIRKLKEHLLFSTTSSALMNERFLSMRKHEHYLTIKQTSDQASNKFH